MRQLPLVDPTPSITEAVAAAGAAALTPGAAAAVVSAESFTAASAMAAAGGVSAAAGAGGVVNTGSSSSTANSGTAPTLLSAAGGNKKSGLMFSSTTKQLGQCSALDRVKERLASGELSVQLSAHSSPSIVTAVSGVNLTGATSGPVLSRSNTEKIARDGAVVEGVGAQGFNFGRVMAEAAVL